MKWTNRKVRDICDKVVIDLNESLPLGRDTRGRVVIKIVCNCLVNLRKDRVYDWVETLEYTESDLNKS